MWIDGKAMRNCCIRKPGAQLLFELYLFLNFIKYFEFAWTNQLFHETDSEVKQYSLRKNREIDSSVVRMVKEFSVHLLIRINVLLTGERSPEKKRLMNISPTAIKIASNLYQSGVYCQCRHWIALSSVWRKSVQKKYSGKSSDY